MTTTINEKRRQAEEGGGLARIEAQHKKVKYKARDRDKIINEQNHREN